MNYATVCSGIEAPSVAWPGWNPVFFSEISPFPCAVLKHHYPDVPNYGDMEKYRKWPNDRTIELICAGTPCQAFSVAGLRKGLDDPRGNLTLVFLGILSKYKPRFVLWENVPGVLSEQTGAFDAFLVGLQEIGYGVAWTVLDAQYFGLAQRRERVFVVGYLGDWRPPAAVLFDQTSMCRHPPPSRKKGESFAADITPSLTSGGRGVERTGESRGQDPVIAGVMTSGEHSGGWSNSADKAAAGYMVPVPDVAWALQERDAKGPDSSTKEGHLIPMAFQSKASSQQSMNPRGVCPTLDKGKGGGAAVAFSIQTNDNGTVRRKDRPNGGMYVKETDQSTTLTKANKTEIVVVRPIALLQQSSLSGRGTFGYCEDAEISKPVKTQSDGQMIHAGMQVRRLTPIECERLQGFPDDYTLVEHRGKPAMDGPRYKALGNSMAVPVMKWIGQRIEAVNALIK